MCVYVLIPFHLYYEEMVCSLVIFLITLNRSSIEIHRILNLNKCLLVHGAFSIIKYNSIYNSIQLFDNNKTTSLLLRSPQGWSCLCNKTCFQC